MRWIKAFAHEVSAHKRMTIVIMALLVLFAIIEDLFTGEALKVDAVAYRTIVEGMRADWLTPYMEQFSSLASLSSSLSCALSSPPLLRASSQADALF